MPKGPIWSYSDYEVNGSSPIILGIGIGYCTYHLIPRMTPSFEKKKKFRRIVGQMITPKRCTRLGARRVSRYGPWYDQKGEPRLTRSRGLCALLPVRQHRAAHRVCFKAHSAMQCTYDATTNESTRDGQGGCQIRSPCRVLLSFEQHGDSADSNTTQTRVEKHEVFHTRGGIQLPSVGKNRLCSPRQELHMSAGRPEEDSSTQRWLTGPECLILWSWEGPT